jgi:hypothetical protein
MDGWTATTLRRTLPLLLVALVAGPALAACSDTEETKSTAPPTAITFATTPPTAVPATTATTARPTTTTAPAPARVEFADAVYRGILGVDVKGSSLTSISMSVTSSAAENLAVTIAPATLFEAQSRGVQSMISTGSQEFRISPGQKITKSVNVACAAMHLDTPTSGNSFAVSGQHSSEMAALVGSSAFTRQPFRIQQFAVWTISDNPSRGGYTGLTGTGGSGPPSDEEIARIRDLFTQAGLDPSQWRALR